MRTYFMAACWAVAILLLAVAARLDLVERASADLLLMVLPMIAFVTLLGGRNCRRGTREA